MKEDWTKQMKQKLEGHQMTPPEGLWEGISNQMGLEPGPAHKSVVIRRWIWAAAAVVLALVGFFAFYNFDEEQPRLEAHHEATTASHSISQESDNQPISADEKVITAEPKTSGEPKLLAMGTQQTPIVETNNLDVIEEQPETSIEEPIAPSAEEKSEPQQELKSEPQQKKQTYLPDVIEPTTASYSESSSKWTIGVAGSNGLLLAANNYANSTNVQPLYNDASPAHYYTNGMGDIAQAFTYTDVESKHHIPLRLGLSLQYQLTDRLALLSGINYTYLESEFIYPLHKHLDFNQKLSYLGIPVGISWKVWSTGHFNIYLTGGTMIEKCIKADISEGELNTHPWQWSINASAGAEYHFTRLFGVYLEPSLGYYFNDGTKLEHYYKDHPLAPSLQFGLRLHLK